MDYIDYHMFEAKIVKGKVVPIDKISFREGEEYMVRMSPYSAEEKKLRNHFRNCKCQNKEHKHV